MKIRHFTTVSILVWALPAIAQQRTPEQMFGAVEAISDASISPSGTHMAFIAPRSGTGNALYTVPVEGDQKPRLAIAASGSPEWINHCDWVSDARLVCTVSARERLSTGHIVGASRVIALNSDGSDIELLSRRQGQNAVGFAFGGGGVIDWLPGQDGAVLMGREYVPEAKIGSLIERRGEGYGVDRIDTLSLATKRIVAPQPDASEFISDGQGKVRIMGTSPVTIDGVYRGTTSYLYRQTDSDRWHSLSQYDWSGRTGFNPWGSIRRPTSHMVWRNRTGEWRFTASSSTAAAPSSWCSPIPKSTSTGLSNSAASSGWSA